MNLGKLAFANLKSHKGRTVGLAVLVAVLAFVVCSGSLVMASLQSGLDSLEARLGADVVVAPKTAKSQVDLQEVLLEGVPGSFYMDASVVSEIAACEGVEKVSPQYYLATVKAGCCSMPVQVVGFDPETDFTVQPWIARTYSGALERDTVVVGCNITGAPGASIKLYGIDCTIVAKLEETGTSLDTAVFATNETLRDLINGSSERGMAVLEERNPADVVSTVQVKLADGYNAENVAGDINVHVRNVWATPSRTMTAGVADGVSGVSRVIGALAIGIWVLAIVILAIAFSLAGKHRAREFAVLRVVGASRSLLSRLVLTEALAVSVVGAVVGVVAALVVVVAFNGAIEAALGLPFLLPGMPTMLLFGALAFAVALVAGPVASIVSARRLSRVDVGQVLRTE